MTSVPIITCMFFFSQLAGACAANVSRKCPFVRNSPAASRSRLKYFYISLGSFVAAALISLIGSVFTVSGLHPAFEIFALLGLLSGTVGVAGLVFGCTMMVRETRLAIQNLAEEAELTARALESV
jgi:hypothetical protein